MKKASAKKLDRLLATAVPSRTHLRDLLWDLRPQLVVAIQQGRKGKAIWLALSQGPESIECRYRTFARALAEFRIRAGIRPAYAPRKSKQKVESTKPVPITSSPWAEQPSTPQRTMPRELKNVVIQQELAPAAFTSNEPQTAGDKLEAFLKKRFTMTFDENSFKNEDELRREDLRRREQKILSQHPDDD